MAFPSADGLVASVEALGEATARGVFRAADLAFGPWTIALLFGAGLFLTVRLRFVQVVHFKDAVRSLRPAASEGKGALSPFQAFMTALAASIGTGNIAGVATAVVSGGPGAVFWIWCYGFFATAIKFTEAVLGVATADSARSGSRPGRCTTCGTASVCPASAGCTPSWPGSRPSPPRPSPSPTRSRW